MSIETKEKEFIVLTEKINIRPSPYKIQLGMINYRFVLHILKENEVIDSKLYDNRKPGVFGFPNLNDLVGWVLRIIIHLKPKLVRGSGVSISPFPPKIDCKRCSKSLPPESMLILVEKERVYCPNCGRIIQHKFNIWEQTVYLQEIEAYLNELNPLEDVRDRFINDDDVS